MRAEMNRASITFREMVPDDAVAVEAVEKACFSVPWSRESFWREAQNQRTAYRLAVDEKTGRVAGYVGCWVIDDEAQITNVAVHPDYRGQGISRRLLENLIATIKERGAERLTLEVRPSNTTALNLYTSLGFVDCGRRPHYYGDGEDAIIMWMLKL